MDLLSTLAAIDEFDDMLHNAKLMPLSDRARMNPEVLAAAVARIREGCESVLAGSAGQRTRHSVAKLEAAARDARPVPVLGGVSVDKDAVYDILDELRKHLADDLRPEGTQSPPPARPPSTRDD